MMLKRKKNPQRLQLYRNPFQQLGEKVNAKQHQLADWMQRKTQHWRKWQQKVFLLILCLILGGSSIYRFLELFDDRNESAVLNVMRPQPIPTLITPGEPSAFPSVTDTNTFQKFRRHIDSMLKTPEGRERYEQFLKDRPGFLDSLSFAEKLSKQSFPNQFKK